ncbi:MAG: hypothetical protein ABSH25_04930 [Syntrophorhabdales bacterium]
MRRWTLPLVLACAMLNAGCMTTQLRNQMNEQASTIPDVYYQQVLNNLAMIVAEPAKLPYFSDPQTSRVSIARTANGSYGISYDLITSAPTGVLTLFNRWMLDRQSDTLTGGQTDTGQWAALTSNDPDKLFSMRAVYRTRLPALPPPKTRNSSPNSTTAISRSRTKPCSACGKTARRCIRPSGRNWRS